MPLCGTKTGGDVCQPRDWLILVRPIAMGISESISRIGAKVKLWDGEDTFHPITKEIIERETI